MSNAAEKIEFEPRLHLQRSLEYRPHVKWMYYCSLVFMSLFAFLVASFTVSEFAAGNIEFSVGVGFFGLFISAILYMQNRFIIRPLAFSKVHVNSDGIILERLGEEILIYFDEIEGIDFAEIKSLGGWFKVKLVSGESYRFTVVLERSEYVLEAIAAANSHIVSSEALENYRLTSIAADHSWARLYSLFRSWPILVHKYLLLPAAVTVFLFIALDFSSKLHTEESASVWYLIFLGIAALNCGLGFIAYSIADLTLMRKTRLALMANPHFVRRNMELEKQIMSRSQKAHLLLVSVTAIAGILYAAF